MRRPPKPSGPPGENGPPAPPAPAASGARRAPSPWTPGFTRFFLAQTLSWAGSSMVPVALAFGVLERTGSASALGLVLAANSVPMLALLLVGGVVADRLPRRPVLVTTHVVGAIAQATTACWFLTGGDSLLVPAGAAALGGAASAVTGPALRGIITDLVPRAALGRANAARALARNLARVAGPGLAGVLVAAADAGWALAVDALALALAAAILASIPDAPTRRTATAQAGEGPRPRRGAVRTLLEDLRGGWREFLSHNWLWPVAAAFFGVNVTIGGIWLVLGPTLALDGSGAAGWGIVLAARAGGQVLGAAIATRWSPRRPLRGVLLLTTPYAAVFAAIGLGAPTLLLAALAVVAGCGSALAAVQWETLLQRRIDPAALSRVASLDMLLSFVSVPIGQVGAPMIAAAWGAHAVVAAGAAICLLALTAPLLNREVRTMQEDGAGRTTPRAR